MARDSFDVEQVKHNLVVYEASPVDVNNTSDLFIDFLAGFAFNNRALLLLAIDFMKHDVSTRKLGPSDVLRHLNNLLKVFLLFLLFSVQVRFRQVEERLAEMEATSTSPQAARSTVLRQ